MAKKQIPIPVGQDQNNNIRTVRLIKPITRETYLACYTDPKEIEKYFAEGWTVHPRQWNLKEWKEKYDLLECRDY
jgi:hypothetical protein